MSQLPRGVNFVCERTRVIAVGASCFASMQMVTGRKSGLLFCMSRKILFQGSRRKKTNREWTNAGLSVRCKVSGFFCLLVVVNCSLTAIAVDGRETRIRNYLYGCPVRAPAHNAF